MDNQREEMNRALQPPNRPFHLIDCPSCNHQFEYYGPVPWFDHTYYRPGTHRYDVHPPPGYELNSSGTPWWRQICADCDQRGHIRSRCGQLSMTLKCTYCGEPHHTIHTCRMRIDWENYLVIKRSLSVNLSGAVLASALRSVLEGLDAARERHRYPHAPDFRVAGSQLVFDNVERPLYDAMMRARPPAPDVEMVTPNVERADAAIVEPNAPASQPINVPITEASPANGDNNTTPNVPNMPNEPAALVHAQNVDNVPANDIINVPSSRSPTPEGFRGFEAAEENEPMDAGLAMMVPDVPIQHVLHRHMRYLVGQDGQLSDPSQDSDYDPAADQNTEDTEEYESDETDENEGDE